MKRCLFLTACNLCLIVALLMPARTQAAGSAWVNDRSTWYYVDEHGQKLIGWQEIDGAWYYLDPSDGKMLTGWQEIDGRWFYLGGNGKMRTGWQQVSGQWYYFGGNGKMRTGWQEVSGKWYYFGSNGRMRTGWQEVSGKWYYLGTNGVMRMNWQEVSGKWYYLGTNGVMRTNWQQVSGKWYYLGTNGVMRTGWQELGSAWYYFNASGVMADDGIYTISGKKYAFASGGRWRGEQSPVFFAAAEFMEEHQIVTDDMSRDEKMRACFDWLANKKNFSECNPWIPHYKGVDWPERYAGYFFEHTTGNCFSVNAAFAYMAKVIGYEEVYCCHDTGHGWAEVDDLVYDPEWARTHSGNWFARSYDIPDPSGLQNYKALRNKEIAWRYVKI